MSVKLNRHGLQQDLFQPPRKDPTLRNLPVHVQEKTVTLLKELLTASRNAQRNEKGVCDER